MKPHRTRKNLYCNSEVLSNFLLLKFKFAIFGSISLPHKPFQVRKSRKLCDSSKSHLKIGLPTFLPSAPMGAARKLTWPSYVTNYVIILRERKRDWRRLVVCGICNKSMPWQHVTSKNQTKMATDEDLDEIRASSRLVFRRWMKATTELPRGEMPQLYFLSKILPENVQRTF